MDTSSKYRSFAELEARGNSELYEDLANGVAADPEILALINRLPESRRQPNLVFGAAQHLGAPLGSYETFRHWVIANWPDIEQLARTRTTQTNEVGRLAVLLPVLGLLAGPIALIEVGASAGLCLYPDRYSYLYDGNRYLHPADGPSTVLLECATAGQPPLPVQIPEVAYRAGVDLNPLDVADTDDMRWLDSLVWPEQEQRRQRLHAAAAIVRADPPHLLRGDLNSTVAELVEQAPRETTVVVFHSAVLNYVVPSAREEFVETVRSLPCHWIANEGVGVLPRIDEFLSTASAQRRGKFVVSLDGQPKALARGHGQSLEWLR